MAKIHATAHGSLSSKLVFCREMYTIEDIMGERIKGQAHIDAWNSVRIAVEEITSCSREDLLRYRITRSEIAEFAGFTDVQALDNERFKQILEEHGLVVEGRRKGCHIVKK